MSPFQTQNPRKWQYTWETLSHRPTLRLFLFSPEIKPSHHCENLNVSIDLEHSLLLVSWDGVNFSVRVPIPKVLIDVGSPVDFKAMEDHIEVKLVLLLPVDHPLYVNIHSVFDEGFRPEVASSDLSVESDLKLLSSHNEVHLFCKSCSTQLTRRPLRYFVEMPSADWREVADNWFGACCCSFGGISEKLVKKYVNSYMFTQGTCLVDAAAIIVSWDDLAAGVVPDCSNKSKEDDIGCDIAGGRSSSESLMDSGSNCKQSLFPGNQNESTSEANEKWSSMPIKKENFMGDLENEIIDVRNKIDTSLHISPTMLESYAKVVPGNELCTTLGSHCCDGKMYNVPSHDQESPDYSVTSSKDQESTERMELLENDRLLNVSLGSGFMVRSSNISKDVDWIELQCTRCSSLLGAYPSANNNGHAPLDGGVRFFKCYTSTSLSGGGTGNLFSKYTLPRMFTKQLIENANDELSFRTVVRDLRTRSLMLQIVVLNSDVWSCSGYCWEKEDVVRHASEIALHPVVKVLFCNCTNATEARLRMLEEWATRNQADEVYMLKRQIEEVIDSLESATVRLPFSCSLMQGLCLSAIER